MPYNFRELGTTSLASFRTAVDDFDEFDTPGYLDELQALCWTGDASQKPSDFSSDQYNKWFYMEVHDLSREPSNPVLGFGDMNLTDNSAFTCQWRFIDSEGREIDTQGEVKTVGQDIDTEFHELFEGQDNSRSYQVDEVDTAAEQFRGSVDLETGENVFETASQQWKESHGEIQRDENSYRNYGSTVTTGVPNYFKN